MKKTLLKLTLLSAIASSYLSASGQYYYEPQKRFKDPYFDIYLGFQKPKDIDLGVNGGIVSEKKYYLFGTDFSLGLNPYLDFSYYSNEISAETTENISFLNIGVAPSINYDIDQNWRISAISAYNYIPYSNSDSVEKISSGFYGAGITYASRNYDLKLYGGKIIPDLDNSDIKGNLYSIEGRYFLGENMFLYSNYTRTKINEDTNNVYSIGVGFPFWK